MMHSDSDRSQTTHPPTPLPRQNRVAYAVPTQVFEPDGTGRDAVSMNLSEGGLFIATDDPPAVGEHRRVSAASCFGAEILAGTAEVRWRSSGSGAAQPAGFGARWVGLELPGAQAVDAAVTSALGRDAVLDDLERRTQPGVLKDKIEDIHGQDLSDELQGFVEAYQEHGERHPFLWKWVCKGLDLTTLSSVDAALRDEVQTIKFLGVMFDVLLDDAADQIRDDDLVEQMLLIAFERRYIDESRIPERYRAYFDFTVRIWEEIETRSRQLPRFDEFADLLEFEYRQLLNCMRYALIVNADPMRLNLAEHDLYQPHNMHMMVNAVIDLMASPGFDRADVGLLREGIWNAQVMGRIGNAVTTWQREIKDRDFTSGVFAKAVSDGTLDPKDLKSGDVREIEARLIETGVEAQLLVEWGQRRDDLRRLSGRIGSVDIESLVDGLEDLIALHLGSRGLK